ncbi:MAG: alpha/beta hydrolase [Nanoarchaeota archaeon]|nr:alpha/beta hydrolase [Nanoarchaeota archaeon]
MKWSHYEDRLKYDLLEKVYKLTMPVLMIVGNRDESTPLEHQKILFNKLPGKKELHVIKDAPHTFKEKKHLLEIKKIFKNWIRKQK